MDTKWMERSSGRYRRNDDKFSVMLIHLSEGWKYLIYDRHIHDYRGPSFDTAKSAMDHADKLPDVEQIFPATVERVARSQENKPKAGSIDMDEI